MPTQSICGIENINFKLVRVVTQNWKLYKYFSYVICRACKSSSREGDNIIGGLKKAFCIILCDSSLGRELFM